MSSFGIWQLEIVHFRAYGAVVICRVGAFGTAGSTVSKGVGGRSWKDRTDGSEPRSDWQKNAQRAMGDIRYSGVLAAGYWLPQTEPAIESHGCGQPSLGSVICHQGCPMSIEELLEQMEQYRLRREQRDYRPEWLQRFVEGAAQLFEPLMSVGRAGFDCQLDERGWLVSLYLGTTEIVGGPRDGQVDHVSFCVDLLRLQGMFSRLTRLEWYSVAAGDGSGCGGIRSLVSVHGEVSGGGAVRLEVLSIPPEVVRPGLHLRTDGVFYETR
ncbi:MAG: hypothetical protein RL215_500 [Planctomycetota bacterium]